MVSSHAAAAALVRRESQSARFDCPSEFVSACTSVPAHHECVIYYQYSNQSNNTYVRCKQGNTTSICVPDVRC